MEIEQKIGLEDLNVDALEPLLDYLPFQDFINFGKICKKFQKVTKLVKRKRINIYQNHKLNEDFLLNELCSAKCTSINLNHCYWLKPETIRQIITKCNLKEIHLLDCQITGDIIRDLLALNLTSLTITYSQIWYKNAIHKPKRMTNGFASLKKLEIYICTKIPVEYTYFFVRNCNNLEDLRVYSRLTPYYEIDKYSPNVNQVINVFPQHDISPPTDSSLWPKLRKLTIDLKEIHGEFPGWFLNKILEYKIITLNDVYLGRFTIEALHNKRVWLGKIAEYSLGNPSMFCLSAQNCVNCSGDAKQSVWEADPQVKTMLERTNYEKYIVQNLNFDDFSVVANQIITNSRDTVKEINFRGCAGHTKYLPGLQMIAQHCQNVSFLDIVFKNWNENNEDLMKTLATLSGLKTLHLPPSALSCCKIETIKKQTQNNRKFHVPKVSFWKVAIGCPQLRQLRIQKPKEKTCNSWVIHEDTLSDIMLCKNLRDLHLIDINTFENDPALPKITKECTKLQVLYIINNVNVPKKYTISPFEESLKNAKLLKIFSFKMRIKLSVSFVNALCICEKLEKVYLNATTYYSRPIDKRVIDEIGKCLPNLKQLCMFYIRPVHDDEPSYKPMLEPVLKRLHDERPYFFYNLGEWKPILE